MTIPINQLKRQAAEAAVEFIQSGMIVGLGHGSTAIWATRRIALLLQEGVLRDVRGVPCSRAVEAEARTLGIPLVNLDDVAQIDLTIDGADEVEPGFQLIKGGGGALLREKLVAQASAREIIVIDESKQVPLLGTGWAVPVEVIAFGYTRQIDFIRSLGAVVTLRQDGSSNVFRTDQDNIILDCRFGPIHAPHSLATAIKQRTGIVEHGLFIDLATDVIIARQDGSIEHLQRQAT